MDFQRFLQAAHTHTGHPSLSWNIYRYCGDYFRAAGHLIVVCIICKGQSTAGLSRSTILLDLIVYCSRYLDLLDHVQHNYLVFFKLFFIGSSFLALCMFWIYRESYEKQKDTCHVVIFIVPSLLVSLFLSNDTETSEVMWTFSQILQGFAMVPQYIFSYRDENIDRRGIVAYITCMGFYRIFYALHWMRKARYDPHYSDVNSWLSGAINIVFFIDYIIYRFFGCGSLLRKLTLGVDDGVNEVSRELRDRLGVYLVAPSASHIRASVVELSGPTAAAYSPVAPSAFGMPIEDSSLPACMEEGDADI